MFFAFREMAYPSLSLSLSLPMTRFHLMWVIIGKKVLVVLALLIDLDGAF
jgi:hypothetical protein